MFEADPDFIMGKIFTLGYDCFTINNVQTLSEAKQKLFDISKQSKRMTELEKSLVKVKQSESSLQAVIRSRC